MAPTPQPRMVNLTLLVLVTCFCVITLLLFAGQQSPDLIATWLAGHFFANGAYDQVYPSDTYVYTMLPPTEWWPYLASEGRSEPVFPYVYPPLWAALTSFMTPVVSLDGFQAAARIVNPVLLGVMIVLALRLAGLDGRRLILATGLGLLIMLATLPGAVALQQNQPQILVSFLIVAALFADRRGAVRLAGATLALAAAIKIYPALIAVLWLAARKYRAVAAFAAVGAGLGLLSVALAGWPLHDLFLREIAIIKNSVMTTRSTYGVDATIANLFFDDRMEFIVSLENPAEADPKLGWRVLAKGAAWSTLSSVAMICLILAAGFWLWIKGDDRPLFWPAFLVGLALVSPLSWSYHFLPALAFAPALPFLWGRLRGTILLVTIFAPISIAATDALAAGAVPFVSNQLAGTLAMTLLGLALLAVPRHRDPAS